MKKLNKFPHRFDAPNTCTAHAWANMLNDNGVPAEWWTLGALAYADEAMMLMEHEFYLQPVYFDAMNLRPIDVNQFREMVLKSTDGQSSAARFFSVGTILSEQSRTGHTVGVISTGDAERIIVVDANNSNYYSMTFEEFYDNYRIFSVSILCIVERGTGKLKACVMPREKIDYIEF